ncbi:formimidoyltetrahydrofolate cyclodeaminase [Blastococcus sp. TBT05-19]|uniref:cyclodeaminase/cyclohydrolase family protein n=1 Tax=Blastococcus sp. TBT05-19 TaxID=2250581 RepID=UPI000DEBE307|nr:cyclodeaminase/cyclohydrolase family protein [Blastococcus sp. TBT05-19]RBY90295.1 formimidoyltetrahydrofolate cyclodeaminase [Blastococcus sp. TBT05-19]
MDTDPDLPRQSMGQFLDELAARLSAPGAGAAAAIEAALAASLVAMVGRFTPDEEHADLVGAVVAEADRHRAAALEAAADDETAFSAVAEAMKLPRGSDEEKEARRRAMAEAQLAAARPPRAVLAIAGELVQLAERILPVANRNLVSDVAAATAAARAAATTALLAVETNLVGLDEPGAADDLTAAAGAAAEVARRADAVEADVRTAIRG